MTDQPSLTTASTGTGNNVVMSAAMRDHRKGNWTITETMVLIEAKKMDDERRSVKRSPETGGKASMEPRWKWVEDYCRRKGCFRSQNQCNDKWDNLMRDYKKVRDHELRRTGDASGGEDCSSSSSSYWKMEKTERKARNLPVNMIPQIYNALVDVVERKGVGGGGEGRGSAVAPVTEQLLLPGIPGNAVTLQPETLPCPLLQQQKHYIPPPSLVPVPFPMALPVPSGMPPPLLREAAVEPPQPTFATSHPPLSARAMAAETPEETSEGHSDTPSKRRRTAGGRGDSGTSGAHDVGTAISRSAMIIAEAIQASDEREERRHRDMVSLHERRLRIEESRNEISQQGINGLVDMINRLAESVQAIVSSSSSSASKSNNNNNQPAP